MRVCSSRSLLGATIQKQAAVSGHQKFPQLPRSFHQGPTSTNIAPWVSDLSQSLAKLKLRGDPVPVAPVRPTPGHLPRPTRRHTQGIPIENLKNRPASDYKHCRPRAAPISAATGVRKPRRRHTKDVLIPFHIPYTPSILTLSGKSAAHMHRRPAEWPQANTTSFDFDDFAA